MATNNEHVWAESCSEFLKPIFPFILFTKVPVICICVGLLSVTCSMCKSDYQKHNAVSQILKTSKYLAAISLGFFIAISPWTICTFIIAVTNIKLPEDLDFAITWLAISNSFWNVIIYSILNRKFRRTAGKLVRKHRAGTGWVNGGSLFGSKLVGDLEAGEHNSSSQRHYNSCVDDYQPANDMMFPDCMMYSGSTYTMSSLESPTTQARIRRMTSKLSYTVTSITKT